jgi:hypothetical protein
VRDILTRRGQLASRWPGAAEKVKALVAVEPAGWASGSGGAERGIPMLAVFGDNIASIALAADPEERRRILRRDLEAGGKVDSRSAKIGMRGNCTC